MLRRQSLPLALVLLGLLYISLFQSYRAYEIDNPWYLSFSRSFLVDHGGPDFFLNGVFPDGMGGTLVFGRLPALLQALILNSARWMPIPAMLVSTGLVLAGLWFWFGFLLRQGASPETSVATILALGLTEPFVGMAERFRYEPFCFLLMSVAFWLAARRRPWMALTVALLALEAEPAAVLVFGTLVIFLVRSKDESKTSLGYGLLLASGCFCLTYFSLHPGIVQTLRDTDWHRGGGQREIGGFLRAYFITRKRHLPELLLLIVAAVVYLRRYCQAPLLVRRMAECTLFVCVFSFLMNWPTPAYMAFFFPFAIVLLGWALKTRWNKPWLLPAITGLLMLPQYAALAVMNRHEGFRAQDFRKVAKAIDHSERIAGLDDVQTQIMGDYSLWFAHPNHFRALSETTFASVPMEQLFLCFDSPLRPPPMVDPIVRYCSDLEGKIALREVEQVDVRGHRLHILMPQ